MFVLCSHSVSNSSQESNATVQKSIPYTWQTQQAYSTSNVVGGRQFKKQCKHSISNVTWNTIVANVNVVWLLVHIHTWIWSRSNNGLSEQFWTQINTNTNTVCMYKKQPTTFKNLYIYRKHTASIHLQVPICKILKTQQYSN